MQKDGAMVVQWCYQYLGVRGFNGGIQGGVVLRGVQRLVFALQEHNAPPPPPSS